MTMSIGKWAKNFTRPKKRMARRPRGHEKIQMNHKRFGYFPQQFTWRGSRYDVHAVERCWTVSRQRWDNKVERLFFRVRCAPVSQEPGLLSRADTDTFELYQDLNTNTWHLAKGSA
jgi:hypothetical protein